MKDEDIIELNVATKQMTLKISEEEIANENQLASAGFKATKGILFKYAQQVKDAGGCVTDEA